MPGGLLPGFLESLIEMIAERVSRRFFTLLPVARSLTMDVDPTDLPGAA